MRVLATVVVVVVVVVYNIWARLLQAGSQLARDYLCVYEYYIRGQGQYSRNLLRRCIFSEIKYRHKEIRFGASYTNRDRENGKVMRQIAFRYHGHNEDKGRQI